MKLIEMLDEISVLSAFLRDVEENGDLVSPVSDIVLPAVFGRIKELINYIGGENNERDSRPVKETNSVIES